jgi:hypothetical protein
MLGETAKHWLGQTLGLVVAPVAYLGSALRHARLFHPHGEWCSARVVADASSRLASLGGRLEGEALVRFSTGLHKTEVERFEVLGCAVRIRGARHGQRSQDLIFGTLKHLWSLPLAPLTTDAQDFFANHYYTVTSFRAPDVGVVTLRLAPVHRRRAPGNTRDERLDHRIADGQAVFAIEARSPDASDDAWTPVAHLTVTSRCKAPAHDVGFSPAHAGRGLQPVGVVNALREVAYEASRAGRRGEEDATVH